MTSRSLATPTTVPGCPGGCRRTTVPSADGSAPGSGELVARAKIAIPSVKISTQAIMLQIAAAKAFGDANYAKLDPLTISLSHPGETNASLSSTRGAP